MTYTALGLADARNRVRMLHDAGYTYAEIARIAGEVSATSVWRLATQERHNPTVKTVVRCLLLPKQMLLWNEE